MSNNNIGATNGASKCKVVGGQIIYKGQELEIPPKGALEAKLGEEFQTISLEPNTVRDMQYLEGNVR